MIKRLFIILNTILLTFTILNSQTPAFPEAEGFGKYATGGRGGRVIKVNNLSASGTGSLRAALESSGPRTVVFEVGGTIDLGTSLIFVESGNLTIAGQTAPGDGILIKGGMIEFDSSNVICRYLRIRPGNTSPPNRDGINITSNLGTTYENFIFDHCSVSWTGDENLDVRAYNSGSKVKNVTFQNCLVAEGGKGALNGEGTSRITYYKNLFAFNFERNVRVGNFSPTEFGVESINNIFYGFVWANTTSDGCKLTVLNNIFKDASGVSRGTTNIVEWVDNNGNAADTYLTIGGNIIPSGTSAYTFQFIPYLNSTPYQTSGIIPVTASALEANILGDVGASFPTRDAVDIRLLNSYNAGTGSLATSGTYPTINGCTPPVDTDNDGMSDVWEDNNGLNKNDPTDRNIVNGQGYTNLELYLNNIVYNRDIAVSVNNLTLTANNLYVDYQWLDCNNNYAPIIGETNQTFTATTTGNYACKLIGACNTDTTACISINTTGVKEIKEIDEFNIFPNPATTELSIQSINTTTIEQVEIIDLTGKIIKTIKINTNSININELATGTYSLKIKTKQEEYIKSFIKN